MKQESFMVWLSAVVCGIGLFLTADSVFRIPQFIDVMKRKVADVDQLLSIQRDRANDLAAVDAFDQLPNKAPPALPDLAAAIWPNNQPSIHSRETRPASAGWSVRRVEVSFDSVRLADLSRFLVKAEEARPPWRLVEFNATAVEPSSASARTYVVLEALEKR